MALKPGDTVTLYPLNCVTCERIETLEREVATLKAVCGQQGEALKAVLAGHAGFDECGQIVYLTREKLQAIRDILSTAGKGAGV